MAAPALAFDEVVLSEADRKVVHDGGSISVGPHRVDIEGELAVLILTGDMSLQQVVYTHRAFEEMLRLGRRLFVLALLSPTATKMSAEIRRWLGEWSRRHHTDAVAFVSKMHWTVNVMTTLLVRGISVLRGQPLPTIFVSTEAEGRTWLDEQRKHIRQKPGQ